MIKNEYVKIPTFGCRKKRIYEELGYDISGEYINLKIIDLTPGSRYKIEVICDYCGNEKSTIYKNYIQVTRNNEDGKYACSHKCGSEKARESNLEKYGVDNPNKLEDIKNRKRKTNLNKYGVEYIMQCDIFKEKSKQTNLEKYGVEYTMQSNIFKEKSRQTSLEKYGVYHYSKTNEFIDRVKNTNLERYGVTNPMYLDEFKQKSEQTMLERYGVTNPMYLEEFKQKSKQTMLDKYGVTNPMYLDRFKEKLKSTNLNRYNVEYASQSDEIKEKIKNTNLERYGYDSVFKSEKIKNKIKETNIKKFGADSYMNTDEFKEKSRQTIFRKYESNHISKSEKYRIEKFNISQHPNYIKYLNDSISLFKCDNGEDHDFEIRSDNYKTRNDMNIPLCTICYPISNFKSIKETELLKYIKSIYQGEIISGYRDGLEIDIYLPELNIGFEFNGLYWHSELYKDKNYHLEKSEYFREKEIYLLHIWEDDWDCNRNIIENNIKNILNMDKKILSNYIITEIDDVESSIFLDKNHLNGFIKSLITLGIYNEGELISIMSFSKNKNFYFIDRFCELLNYNTFEILLNEFLNNYHVINIGSYDDITLMNLFLFNYKIEEIIESRCKYIIDNKRINENSNAKNIKIYDAGGIIFKTKK